MQIHLISIMLFTLVSLLTACPFPNRGNRQMLQFTLSNCGLHRCSVEQPIAVGGRLDAQLMRIDGTSAENLRLMLTSASGNILSVSGPESTSGGRTWQIRGLDEGVATLKAQEDRGVVLDTLSIRVSSPRKLSFRRVTTNAVGPTFSAGSALERWMVPSGQPIELRLVAVNSRNEELIGDLQLQRTDRQPLPGETTRLDNTSGLLAATLPRGQYHVRYSLAGTPIAFEAILCADDPSGCQP